MDDSKAIIKEHLIELKALCHAFEDYIKEAFYEVESREKMGESTDPMTVKRALDFAFKSVLKQLFPNDSDLSALTYCQVKQLIKEIENYGND